MRLGLNQRVHDKIDDSSSFLKPDRTVSFLKHKALSSTLLTTHNLTQSPPPATPRPPSPRCCSRRRLAFRLQPSRSSHTRRTAATTSAFHRCYASASLSHRLGLPPSPRCCGGCRASNSHRRGASAIHRRRASAFHRRGASTSW
ncbi:hypothetical protein PIB30_079329 [Stylosanthes scabra]|uniref:Uncharacterized protein n=1 Tax=Stylosanthes scabra TaxID=79078 RepID=A0ABU6VTQ7_9FABA|nr:hypothetical protein [Stylosanthes scabra]